MDDDLDGDEFDLGEEHHAALMDMLDQCVRWLLADDDRERFLDWLAAEGPNRFRAAVQLDEVSVGAIKAGSRPAGTGVDEQRFLRAFGLGVWAATPLPSNGFKPPKLVLPGRNEPCVCGSGQKFKHCCQPLYDDLPPLEPELLGGLAIAALPPAQWKVLPTRGATAGMVQLAADMLDERGRLADALRLLEPWAQGPAPWPADRAELLDLLADLYLEAGKPRKRKALAQAMVANGGTEVQSVGWQRLAMLAADAGDTQGADEAFARAQRLTPDSPRLAVLEVTLLLGTGRVDRAMQRADFHTRRLARMPPGPEVMHTLEALQRLLEGDLDGNDDDEDGGDDDFDTPRGVAGGLNVGAPLGLLMQAIDRLPPPKLRLRLDRAQPDDLGALSPDAASAKALREWRGVFPLSTAGMAHHGVSGDWDQVFAPDERWTRCFISHPLLADNFEALDGVATVLEVLPPGLAEQALATLTARGLALWAQLRERFPQARCEWGHLDNRPALRLIVRRVMVDDSPRADNAFDWLQALVEVLNPHDNHGLRERLAAVYLRRGLAADALALCERYPDDFIGMQLLHARALLALQRPGDARPLLQAALTANPHLGPLLQSRRKPRRPAVDRYSVGSREEALLVVGNQHDLWGADKAVQGWVGQVLAGDAPPSASLPLFPDGGDTRID